MQDFLVLERLFGNFTLSGFLVCALFGVGTGTMHCQSVTYNCLLTEWIRFYETGELSQLFDALRMVLLK